MRFDIVRVEPYRASIDTNVLPFLCLQVLFAATACHTANVFTANAFAIRKHTTPELHT